MICDPTVSGPLSTFRCVGLRSHLATRGATGVSSHGYHPLDSTECLNTPCSWTGAEANHIFQSKQSIFKPRLAGSPTHHPNPCFPDSVASTLSHCPSSSPSSSESSSSDVASSLEPSSVPSVSSSTSLDSCFNPARFPPLIGEGTGVRRRLVLAESRRNLSLSPSMGRRARSDPGPEGFLVLPVPVEDLVADP